MFWIFPCGEFMFYIYTRSHCSCGSMFSLRMISLCLILCDKEIFNVTAVLFRSIETLSEGADRVGSCVGGLLYTGIIPSITTYSKTTCAVVKTSKLLSSPVYKCSIWAAWYFPAGRLVSLTSVKASVSVTSSLTEINWLWSLWGSLLLLQT